MCFQSKMTAFLTTCEIFYLFFLGYMHTDGFIFILDDSIYSNNGENTESYKHSTGKNKNKTHNKTNPNPNPKHLAAHSWGQKACGPRSQRHRISILVSPSVSLVTFKLSNLPEP